MSATTTTRDGPFCAAEDCERHATDAIHGVELHGQRFTLYVCEDHTGEALTDD